MLIKRFGIDITNITSLPEVIDGAEKILTLNNATARTVIDFDDQIYLPQLLELKPARTFDWLLVDEAQDLSLVQRHRLEAYARPGARLLAVGDPHQSIYAWRGADPDSMTELAKRWHAAELPLSVSYRCPRTVVEKAKAFSPDIESHPDANEGVVCKLAQYGPDTFKPGDLILCRENAPLFHLALQLTRRRCDVALADTTFVEEVCTLVDQMDGDTSPKARARWLARAKRVNQDNPAAIARTSDKLKSLEVVRAHLCVLVSFNDPHPADIKKTARRLLSGGTVKLSSIHRAKGLEAERVFILDAHLSPSPWAREDWQLKEEENLQYVAITRSLEALIDIHSNGFIHEI
jgi:superfamily I DNA/RNA helicase